MHHVRAYVDNRTELLRFLKLNLQPRNQDVLLLDETLNGVHMFVSVLFEVH